jgi:hypothetical protein
VFQNDDATFVAITAVCSTSAYYDFGTAVVVYISNGWRRVDNLAVGGHAKGWGDIYIEQFGAILGAVIVANGHDSAVPSGHDYVQNIIIVHVGQDGRGYLTHDIVR